MKKVLTTILAVVFLFALMAAAAYAEGEDTVTKDGFTCVRLRDGRLKLVRYEPDTAMDTVDIPDSIDGLAIERIGEYAFQNGQMTTITIPKTVKVIEAHAFDSCARIQTIFIPDTVVVLSGNPFTRCSSLAAVKLNPKHPSLELTRDGALYNKISSTLVYYPCSATERSFSVKPGTTSIGECAFYNCNNLETISLPSSVTEIGAQALAGCENLRSISLPNSLLLIGREAFMGCKSLSGISIPGQVLRIEPNTFNGCVSLTNVSFPANLTNIEERAFYGCRTLREISLPSNMHTIGDEAFKGCSALKDVYIPISVTQIGEEVFENCDLTLWLHVNEYSYAKIYADLYEIQMQYEYDETVSPADAE